MSEATADQTTIIQPKPGRTAEHLQKYSWSPGQSGNPAGRPKGSRAKLSDDFVEALYQDFKTNGQLAIEKTRETKPEIYVQIIAKLLPRDVKIELPQLNKIAHVIVDVANDEQLIDTTAVTEIQATPVGPQLTDSIDITEDQHGGGTHGSG